ncbi:MAG: hypothetical protein ACI97A_000255 [Planctomycetota bacterium]|jgi:hypothetical protein
MSTRITVVAFLLLSLFSADLMAQSSRRKSTRSRAQTQEKTLSERDPGLYAWVTTLVLNLQKEHKIIRNSAAQALISVGGDAAPMLVELRERSTMKQRRLINRILERMTRGTGKNLFKDSAGGAAPKTLARDIGAVLKLNKAQTTRLNGVIVKAQEQKRSIDLSFKKKKFGPKIKAQKVETLLRELDAELSLFLDRQATDYVTLRLGVNPAAAKKRVDPKTQEDELNRRRPADKSDGK